MKLLLSYRIHLDLDMLDLYLPGLLLRKLSELRSMNLT